MSPTAERYFFEIPIYWLTESDFDARYSADLESRLAGFRARHGGISREIRANVETEFRRTYGGPWRYNQAVGWLQLYVRNSRIRADEWFTQASRVGRRMRHKDICLTGKAFEISCGRDQSSAEIYQSVLSELCEYRRASRPRFILDQYCFESVGPFLNWRALVDERAA